MRKEFNTEKTASATSDLHSVQNGVQNLDLYVVQREARGMSVPGFFPLEVFVGCQRGENRCNMAFSFQSLKGP